MIWHLLCLSVQVFFPPHGSQGFLRCPLPAGAEGDVGLRAVQLHGADRGSLCGWLDYLPPRPEVTTMSCTMSCSAQSSHYYLSYTCLMHLSWRLPCF
ncbi:hypothetical protein GDO81_002347 [Engystomops pustulosus]|uniref:Secreted protein n=1 Tax=Engystomops pustulosus TaxID=76066 RepID=A0AAV7DKH1_ENGPU|nr:hypothetical protein GDO81_002347 [Engystomops pustulosus]